MKRILLLILIAIVTFLLFILFTNMDILENIWLWLIGFAGVIVQTGISTVDYFKSLFGKSSPIETETKKTTLLPDQPGTEPKIKSTQLDASTIQLNLLRFHDDTQTTLGLLYINSKFYCYTLEDTYRQVKIAKETRIPAGSYSVDFNKEETELTRNYRQQFPEWFTYHLHIRNVPNFEGIYIHNGGTHKDTAGCILVSDSLNISKENKVFSNSKNTFEMLYKYITKNLTEGKKVFITIKNENWASNLSD